VGGGISIPSEVGGVPDRESGVLTLWDAETKEARLSVTEPNDQIGSVLFYPDGSALAVGDRKKLQVINPATGALKFRVVTGGDFSSYPVAINQRYKILTTKGYDFWDSESGEPKPHPSPFPAGSGEAFFSSDGSFYYAGAVVFTVLPWTVYLELDQGRTQPAAFSHDTTLLATPTSVWSLKERKIVWFFGEAYSHVLANRFAFTPDDRFLLATEDGELRIYDVVTGTLAGKFRLSERAETRTPEGKPKYHDPVEGVAFSLDCKSLATISTIPGQSVRVWKVGLKRAN
jgi:WD40 repeat protein